MMQALRLQRFPSTPDDLDVETRAQDPGAVTAVLSRCLHRASGARLRPDELWTLDVGERTAWLLRIAADAGAERFDVRVHCNAPACGQTVEIELPLHDLLQLGANEEGVVGVEVAGRTLTLRRPTGADQLAWSRQSFSNLVEARRAVASSLLVDPGESDTPLGAEVLDAMESSLAEHDPLVQFTVSSECPYCGASAEYDVDLTALAMAWLRHAQVAMLETVHSLATAYHWSEAEVFALAPWRRAHYLALVERDERLRR